MANDKTKNDKTDLTIEERLKALYQLQTLLSKIDECLYRACFKWMRRDMMPPPCLCG